MNENIVKQVEKWYAENSDTYSKVSDKLRFRSSDAADAIRGKAVIEVDTPSRVASIMFWNRELVSVVVVDKVLRKDFVLDDRKLRLDDSVDALLNDYLKRIVQVDPL